MEKLKHLLSLVSWGTGCDSYSPVCPILTQLEAQLSVYVFLILWMFLLVIKLVLFGGIETKYDSVAKDSLKFMAILLLKSPESY